MADFGQEMGSVACILADPIDHTLAFGELEGTLGSGTADAYAVETAGSREEEARVDCNHCMVPAYRVAEDCKGCTEASCRGRKVGAAED